MIFGESNSRYLAEKLCINVSEFEEDLNRRFGSQAICLDVLVSFLLQDEARDKFPGLDVMNQCYEGNDMKERAFNHIRASFAVDERLEDYLHEIMCYFQWYFCGGLVELFKHRQAENQGPRVYLTQRIVSDEIIVSNLPPIVTAYRGMSVGESQSGAFGMSWTLSREKAEDFAFTTYNDEPRGVVVSTTIDRDSILYFAPSDSEREVVVANNSLTDGSVVST
ncbi:hypothetical protein AB4151_07650 [Vibrio splendidus]|uniref:Uncharacterized protein n=1 Tax=Vibrio splendidus TaxID=29497 RepID=A0A2N7C885_VIBSP|nr:hypothetical protein [Vibrio splendidus]PMF17180.1 hypothetical protein BCV19_19245 [Vibrio splendidus]